MNPFNNNKPNLSASDRIRDKKSAYIYNATKKKFQMGKKTCGSKNIKLYKKGTIRSVSSYKMQQYLARGNVLCEDCNDKGMLCTPIVNRKNLEKTTIENNAVSEFWGGATLTPWLNPALQINPSQAPGFTVIESDISGVWGGTATDPSKSIIGPDASVNNIRMPYGYIKNLIKIPRNLNGYGIAIDASGILFPSTECGTFRYMKNVQEKIIVQATMELDVFMGIPGDPVFSFTTMGCKNYLADLTILKGTYVLCRGQTIDQSLTGMETTAFIGVVKDVCCDCVLTFNIELFFMNRDIGVPQFGTPFLNDNSSTLPEPWYEITVDFWGIRNAFDNYIAAKAGRGGAGGGGRVGIKAFKVIQGDPCYSYALSYNNRTRQNYMFCLEDNTKKINLKKSKLFTCVQQTGAQGESCFRAGDCTGGTITDFIIDTVLGPQTYRYHTFDASGTFTMTYPYNIDTAPTLPMTVMLVGGGGGGGGGSLGGGGGGGAGGSMNVPPDITAETFRLMDPSSALVWTAQIIIGEGGAGGTAGQPGFQGGITKIIPLSMYPPPWPFVPPLFQCYPGGGGYTFFSNNGGGEAFCSFLGGSTGTTTLGGGGDGGCFQPGILNLNLGQDANGVGNFAGDGGDGQPITLTGTEVKYGGGGGGGAGGGGTPGTGGGDGGGNGSNSSPGAGASGTPNLGGGGGGGANGGAGGNGGSGRVIIRYRLCT